MPSVEKSIIIFVTLENRKIIEYSNSVDKPNGSTSAFLQLFEMKESSGDDSEIEDFCLDYLFEEIVDLPEVLIDEQLNNSSDPELESLLSSDSFVACVVLPQYDDDFLFIDFDENFGDQWFHPLLFFVIIFIISYIMFLYFIS